MRRIAPRAWFPGALAAIALFVLPAALWAQSTPPSPGASQSPAPPAEASSQPGTATSSSAAPSHNDESDSVDDDSRAPVSGQQSADHDSAPHALDRSRPEPPPPGYGRLRVAVNRPDTEVFVDGRSIGIAPIDHDLLRGPHLVRIACGGFKDWNGSVDIDEGMLTPVRVVLRPQPDRTSGGVTLALATIVLGAGIATGVASNLDRAALEADLTAGRLDNHDSRIDRGAILAGVADGCFVLTAVLVSAGIYLVAHDSGSRSIGHVGRTHRLAPAGSP